MPPLFLAMIKLPIIAHSPWSPSKAGLANKCPLAFTYRYIEKRQGKPRGSAALIGTVVHRAQELLLAGQDIDTALDTALVESDQELTVKERKAVLGFSTKLVSFKRKLDSFREKHNVTRMNLEGGWAVDRSFNPCRYDDNENAVIRGIVDLSLFLDSGYVIIIDHKSGRLRPTQYYRTQLDFYSIMALAHFPEAKGVQCALNYLGADKVIWGTPLTSSHIRKTLHPWLAQYLTSRAERVLTPTPHVSPLCGWCDYEDICPARRSDNDRGSQRGGSPREETPT